MALTPARVVARLLANGEQAGGCVVTLYSGMTTEQRRPLLGTKPKQVPA